jgi:hypothetical protein
VHDVDVPLASCLVSVPEKSRNLSRDVFKEASRTNIIVAFHIRHRAWAAGFHACAMVESRAGDAWTRSRSSPPWILSRTTALASSKVKVIA